MLYCAFSVQGTTKMPEKYVNQSALCEKIHTNIHTSKVKTVSTPSALRARRG